MEIRAGRVDETETLLDIWNRSVRATHQFLTEIDMIEIEPEVRRALEGMDVWVADAGGAPAGFMIVACPMVEALFVDPDRFGSGVGSMLLRHARWLCGDNEDLWVDVNADNLVALAFYLARGFKKISRSERDSAGRPFPILHLKLAGTAGE